MTNFVEKACLELGGHPLWRDVYTRIEHELQAGERSTQQLETIARLYPLSPTLRGLERIGLINNTRTLKPPFDGGSTWALRRKGE